MGFTSKLQKFYFLNTQRNILFHYNEFILFQIDLSVEKSPIGKYPWIYRNTCWICWFNTPVCLQRVAYTQITFVWLEKKSKWYLFWRQQRLLSYVNEWFMNITLHVPQLWTIMIPWTSNIMGLFVSSYSANACFLELPWLLHLYHLFSLKSICSLFSLHQSHLITWNVSSISALIHYLLPDYFRRNNFLTKGFKANLQ